jgi:hypothetical protein
MLIRFGGLANASAQETSVVMQTDSTAGKKIGDRRHRFPVAIRAGTDCQDELAQGKPSARFEDLSVSFHTISVSFESNCGAIFNSEYLVHKSRAVIHSLFTLELTAERHFCSIFKHKLCS